jgi:sugar phosphate isomerase/epimerase
MKLGISSYTYPWSVGAADSVPERTLDAFDLLARARALGVRVLQLAGGMAMDTVSPAQLDALAVQADDAGISLELGTRIGSKAEIDAYLAVARRLRARILRVVLQPAAGPPDVAVALLRAAVADLEDAGVVLGVETHASLRAAVLRSMMDAVDSRYVGVVFDTANSLGCFEPAEYVLDQVLPHVVNFHAKDVRVRRSGHSQGFVIEGAPAGSGMLDLPGLINCVRAHPAGKAIPEVNVIVEHWMPSCASMAETVAQEARWGEQSVRYLRQFVRD